MSTLLILRLIHPIDNWLGGYHLQRSATEHPFTFVSFPQDTTGLAPNRESLLSSILHGRLIPSASQVQRSTIEHPSACTSQSHWLEHA
jgi:hypothetical protein